MKSNTNKGKSTKAPRNGRTNERTSTSKDGGRDGLIRSRVQFTSTLPMGRPFPVAESNSDGTINVYYANSLDAGAEIQTIARNVNDKTGLLRPSCITYVVSAMFTTLQNPDSGTYQWFERVAQHILNRLRDEVRSNTKYSVNDVKNYLIHVMSAYLYGVVLKRKLQSTAIYDTRAPGLAQMLTISPQAQSELNGTYLWQQGHQDYSVGAAFTSELGDAWLATTKVHAALAYYVLPAGIKALIDEYFADLLITDTDGQYYSIDCAADSYVSYDGANGFNQYPDDSNIAKHLTAAGISDAAAIITSLMNQNEVMGTLIADLRRISGMERCIITMPPEMGGAPQLKASPTVFTSILNAYSYSTKGLRNHLANNGTDLAPETESMSEVRISGFTDLNDPNNVGPALILCSVSNKSTDTQDLFGHSLFKYRFTNASMFRKVERNQYTGITNVWWDTICIPAMMDLQETISYAGSGETTTADGVTVVSRYGASQVMMNGIFTLGGYDIRAPVVVYVKNTTGADASLKGSQGPTFSVLTQNQLGTRVSKNAVNDILDAYNEFLFTMR